MSSVAGTGGRFTLICVGAALVLGLVNALTAPVIKAREERNFQAVLKSLVNEETIGAPQKADTVPAVRAFYPVRDKAGKTVSLIVDLQGEGYGGDFSIIAAYKRNGEILSARLLQNKETPGMGKKAESADYLKKFVGMGADKPVPVRKVQLKAEDAQAVTGATTTFIGIAKALETGSKFVQGLGEIK
jgi:electron transport complex protein RnfG